MTTSRSSSLPRPRSPGRSSKPERKAGQEGHRLARWTVAREARLTDALGAFEIREIAAGSYYLHVEHEAHPPLRLGPGRSAKVSTISDETIRLEEGIDLVVRVVDSRSREPVPKAHVCLEVEPPTNAAAGASTDAQNGSGWSLPDPRASRRPGRRVPLREGYLPRVERRVSSYLPGPGSQLRPRARRLDLGAACSHRTGGRCQTPKSTLDIPRSMTSARRKSCRRHSSTGYLGDLERSARTILDGGAPALGVSGSSRAQGLSGGRSPQGLP